MCTLKLKGGKHNLRCCEVCFLKEIFSHWWCNIISHWKGLTYTCVETVFFRWLKSWKIGMMGMDWSLKEIWNRPSISQIWFLLKWRIQTSESGLVLKYLSNQNLTFTLQGHNPIQQHLQIAFLILCAHFTNGSLALLCFLCTLTCCWTLSTYSYAICSRISP